MPSLERLHQHFRGEPFVVLGIDTGEEKDKVLSFVRDSGLTFTTLLDEDGEVSARYGVRSTPAKILIDTEGNVVGAALGYKDWDSDEVHELIRLLISKKST
ncbi:MAG: TlpA family protein disulfide reductase [Nitrospiraceae bacterium]|nr:MAG: TlpA family protein disulfide reductase [Nitrospiraceae bacterium]